MLENIMQLIKENAGEAVINNADIPNEHKEAVLQETGTSIVSGLQGMLAQGKIKDVLGLFSNPSNVNSSNAVVQQLSGGVLQALMGKFGLNSGQAGNIVSTLIPTVLSKLVGKTQNPADSSFNIQAIFNSLSGGNTAGIDVQGLMGKMAQGSGLDRDGDSDVDLQDLAAAFTGGGKAGGNPLEALKGLFGN
jgi:hypothetical protein